VLESGFSEIRVLSPAIEKKNREMPACCEPPRRFQVIPEVIPEEVLIFSGREARVRCWSRVFRKFGPCLRPLKRKIEKCRLVASLKVLRNPLSGYTNSEEEHSVPS